MKLFSTFYMASISKLKTLCRLFSSSSKVIGACKPLLLLSVRSSKFQLNNKISLRAQAFFFAFSFLVSALLEVFALGTLGDAFFLLEAFALAFAFVALLLAFATAFGAGFFDSDFGSFSSASGSALFQSELWQGLLQQKPENELSPTESSKASKC